MCMAFDVFEYVNFFVANLNLSEVDSFYYQKHYLMFFQFSMLKIKMRDKNSLPELKKLNL